MDMNYDIIVNNKNSILQHARTTVITVWGQTTYGCDGRVSKYIWSV